MFYTRLLFRKLVHMLTYDFLCKNLIPLNRSEQLAFFQRDDVRVRMDRILEQINMEPSIRRVSECIRNDSILCEIIQQYMDAAELIQDGDIDSYDVRILLFDDTSTEVEPTNHSR